MCRSLLAACRNKGGVLWRCRYDFPKDTKKTLEDSVQKTTDGFVKKVDDMVKAKTDDIMKV